jgi:putative flippase GtrA
MPDLRQRLPPRLREVSAFAVVGVLAAVVDLTAFNVLRLSINPFAAKAISLLAAALLSFAGNRWWVYRHRHHGRLGQQLAIFAVLNGVGLLITESCLLVSHDLLQLRGAVADNVSANVVGFLIATAFRLWAYGRWVFLAEAPRAEVVFEPV